MSVLVTGGAGFIGSALVDLLVAGGHEVVVVGVAVVAGTAVVTGAAVVAGAAVVVAGSATWVEAQATASNSSRASTAPSLGPLMEPRLGDRLSASRTNPGCRQHRR